MKSGTMPQPSEIVLLPFPFADLSASKLRPVLVLTADNPLGDFLAAQVTSQTWHPIQIPLAAEDLLLGTLPKASIVRPDKLFTLSKTLVVRRVGKLTEAAFGRIREAVCRHLDCRP